MATTGSRFRRLTDLFVEGAPVKMPDGTHLWVQVINAYERDECISDAQIARSRIILALKDNGDERMKIEARLREVGHEQMASELARLKSEEKTAEITDELRDDPEWKERFDMVLRTDADQIAGRLSPEEEALLDKTNIEIITELGRRQTEEREFQERRLMRLDESEFIDEWVEAWVERRGSQLANAEYRLTEVWFATRYCDAVPGEDGALDHHPCNGHRQKVFETKNDARSAPTQLFSLLRSALDEVNLGGRDPKGSASPESSSDSSPPPSGPEGSKPSTSTATPAAVPGT